MKLAEDSFRHSQMPQVHYNIMVGPKKVREMVMMSMQINSLGFRQKLLEKAKELLSLVEQPTMEQKVCSPEVSFHPLTGSTLMRGRLRGGFTL